MAEDPRDGGRDRDELLGGISREGSRRWRPGTDKVTGDSYPKKAGDRFGGGSGEGRHVQNTGDLGLIRDDLESQAEQARGAAADGREPSGRSGKTARRPGEDPQGGAGVDGTDDA